MVADSEKSLERFTIVLSAAQSAGNVGSVCRAMKNMGFSKLILAGCSDFDTAQVKNMAVHAFDLYCSAGKVASLSQALAHTSVSAGFTRRIGAQRKSFSLGVTEFAELVSNRTEDSIALVFGNERTGLSRQEMEMCTYAVHIPTSEAFPSMNLAHAVLIACYELRKFHMRTAFLQRPGIERESILGPVDSIIGNLKKIGFFKVTRETGVEEFMRDIIARAGMNMDELRKFENIFSKIGGMVGSRAAQAELPAFKALDQDQNQKPHIE